ncbi:hypothetical protein L873DRAFT_1847235 [Choiromyces venosus 120613-1]|uniref:DUF7779 domain-containing protein n=1 Tax=Choiromyces venosus 120613-1 TaxID=1336337 RepID=A0A3N4J4Y2_9PEZI|nr:hypothetical protein L873DRAFT_1847235 [Choiromyces venosus 120613-1]
MAGEEAQELFSKSFLHWGSLEAEERKVVLTILESLDHLPLAVVGAAAFMTATNTPPSEYWPIFQRDESERKKLLLREFSDIRSEADVTETARLLRLIAFFDRQNIPEELLSQFGLEGMGGSIEFREAIGNLLGSSFVTGVKREGKQFYELHRLVQLPIRAYLSTRELLQWKATALRVFS